MIRKEPATSAKPLGIVSAGKTWLDDGCSGVLQISVHHLGRGLMLQITASPISQFVAPQDSKALITERVRGEFREMPGLTLTLAQAGRLWSLDAATCGEVLSHLVDTGYLCRRSDGAFCRASDLTGRPGRIAHA